MTPWAEKRRAALTAMSDAELIDYLRQLFPPDLWNQYVFSASNFHVPTDHSRRSAIELAITLERQALPPGEEDDPNDIDVEVHDDEPEQGSPFDIEVTTLSSDNGIVAVRAYGGEYQTASAEYIIETLFPRWAAHFLPKNADYGDQHRYALGPQAEYVGIDRKMYKLEEVLWHKRDLNGEQAKEILYDIIGQSFILLDLLDGNWEPRSRRAH